MMESEVEGQKRFVQWCAESGRIMQAELATRSRVSRQTISRCMLGMPVASQTRYALLFGLNAIRAERGLPDVTYDDILWTWE